MKKVFTKLELNRIISNPGARQLLITLFPDSNYISDDAPVASICQMSSKY